MVCDLISPERNIKVENVNYVKVPGTKGSFGILKKHAPIVSSLEPGAVKVILDDKTKLLFAIPSGGFVEVTDDQVTIIAEEVLQQPE